MKLYKLTYPEWIKEFDNVEDLRQELLTHICKDCMGGDPDFDFKPLNKNSPVEELSATICGMDYDVEY
jgi:hypothetical protein